MAPVRDVSTEMFERPATASVRILQDLHGKHYGPGRRISASSKQVLTKSVQESSKKRLVLEYFCKRQMVAGESCNKWLVMDDFREKHLVLQEITCKDL